MFRMTFSTNTPAFGEEGRGEEKLEINNVLSGVQGDIRSGKSAGECTDSDGNIVGSWGISSRTLEKELADKAPDELRALLISAYDNKDTELCSAITAEFERRCIEEVMEKDI